MYNMSTIDNTSGPGDATSSSVALSAGIIGLFVQGLETGLVLAQLSSWLSFPDYIESRLVITLTIFVTTVGFMQTGISFASTWQIYVGNFGQPVVPGWVENIQNLVTSIIAAPVQFLLIWRCYHIVRGNLYVIVGSFMIMVLESSLALSILVSVGLLSPHSFHDRPINPDTVWSPFILSAVFPVVLDMAISYILLDYLTQIRRRVYVDHKRQRVAHFINIVWQSAVPPTLCSLVIPLLYVISQHFHLPQLIMWFPTIQAMIGKLYILSLFYNLNARTLFAGEQSPDTAYVISLTVPAFEEIGVTHEARQSTRHLVSVHSVDENHK